MKLLAFGASNSTTSINKKLVTYAAGLLDGVDVEVIDLNDYALPLFSEDKEKEIGQPQEAKDFFAKIGDSDGLIISLAEHNGSYTAAYKNLFDWCSRIDQKLFQNKPIVYLATSPGPGGASNVLASAKQSAPYFAGEVKADLSIPQFYENFDVETGSMKNDVLKEQLTQAVQSLV